VTRSLYEELAEAERTGAPAALATIVRARGAVPRHAGSKMLVFADGRIVGTIGGGEMESRVVAEARKAIESGEAKIVPYAFSNPERGDPGVCGGEVEVFVEPVAQRPTLVVMGAGHVGRAVIHLAHWLGFRTVACDDRPEFAAAQAVPEADQVLACPLSELTAAMTITADTYLVLTTRGVPLDVEALPALLASPAAYIGVIGSRKRWETTAAELRQQGVSAEALSRVTSPTGLELKAETPEEIAVSILAQIILLRRGGTGDSMAHPATAGAAEARSGA